MKNYGIICDIGGKGKGNQDSAFYTEFDLIIAPGSPESNQFSYRCILSIVCDGVSASSHGEKGSSYVIRALSKEIIQIIYDEDFDLSKIHIDLEKAIIKVNLDLCKKYEEEVKSGKIPKTTLVGILIIGQWLWVFNIGDSKAFVIKDSLINQISIDDVGVSTSHEITQALGNESIIPHIAVYNWAFENDAASLKKAFLEKYYFLICSDGLTDKVGISEIKDILNDDNSNQTIQDKVESLYIMTMERQIDDNVSIIAVDLANYFNSISPIQILKLTF